MQNIFKYFSQSATTFEKYNYVNTGVYNCLPVEITANMLQIDVNTLLKVGFQFCCKTTVFILQSTLRISSIAIN